MKLIQKLKPLVELIPEIPTPDRRQPFQERLIMTIICVAVYSVMSQLPLYGIRSATADPFYHQRSMIGSSRGTLMELGVGPILTANMIMQILGAARLFEVNHNLKEDRMAFQGIQKLAAIVFALVQSVFFVVSGIYGPLASVGIVNAILVVFQLFGASVVVLLLDELIQKGYGLGSGVSLFTCTTICMDVAWKGISPISFTNSPLDATSDAAANASASSSTEIIGAFLALPQLLITRDNKLMGLLDALFLRKGMAYCSIFAVLVTVAVGVLVAYFQTWRVEMTIKHQNHRQEGKYPIKLFYTSNIPLLMYSCVAGNIFMISQVLYSAFPNSFFVNITGKWSHVGGINGLVVPTAGIPYYISPPASFLSLFLDPFHVLFYGVLLLSTSAVFAKIWVEVSGTSPKGVAKDLKEQQLTIRGSRDTVMEKELNRYIPTAAALGGIIVGGLSFVADLLGSACSGSCIVVAVTVIFQYYEILLRESGGMFQNLLGE